MRSQRYALGPLLVLLLLASTAGARGQQIPRWEIADTTGMWYSDVNDVFNDQDLLAAADEHHIVVVGADLITRSKQRIRRTTDGGATWHEVLADPTNRQWTSIAHPAPSMIVIAGDTAVPIGSGGGTSQQYRYHGRCWISRNGGTTWDALPLDSNTRVRDIAMCSDRHGAMVILNTSSDTATDYLLRTDDGWATTARVPLPEGHRLTSQIVCPAPDVYILMSRSLEQQRNVLLRTTDGGATWRSSDQVERVTKMSFLNADTGWCASGESTGLGDRRRDVIMRTTDGGITWHTLLNEEIGARPFGLSAVAFADADNGIAVGAVSKILRTTDGGAHWVQEFPPSALPPFMQPMVSIVYPKPGLCIAAFKAGPIIRYSGLSTLRAPAFTRPQGNGPINNLENLTVGWTPIDGATQYRLVIAGRPVSDGNIWDTTIYATPVIDTITAGTSIVLNGLSYDHFYYARVRAFNASQSSDWGRAEALFYTRSEGGGIAPPAIITPAAGALDQPTTVTVTWEPLPEAVSYDVQIDLNPLFTGPPVLNDSSIQSTSRVAAGLLPDTRYFVRVRARHAGGATDWSSAYGPHMFRTTATSAVPTAPHAGSTHLRVHPNPVRDVAMIDPGERAGAVHLYDALGRLVRSVGFNGPAPIALHVADLPEGSYTAVVAAGAERWNVRLIVVR